MTSEDIEGWRISLEGQVLEISGPGNLKIEIADFNPAQVTYDIWPDMDREPPVIWQVFCDYYVLSEKSKICLGYYFTEEPEVYLFTGCAFWLLPPEFAGQIFKVFLMGDTSCIGC